MRLEEDGERGERLKREEKIKEKNNNTDEQGKE